MAVILSQNLWKECAVSVFDAFCEVVVEVFIVLVLFDQTLYNVELHKLPQILLHTF